MCRALGDALADLETVIVSVPSIDPLDPTLPKACPFCHSLLIRTTDPSNEPPGVLRCVDCQRYFTRDGVEVRA